MSKVMQKPFVIRFKIDEFLLTSMYLCFFNKIPLDMIMAMHEKFGKHALFFFKALACKNYIRVTDNQFYNILESCRKLTKQIKAKEIKRADFDEKMNKFLDYLLGNTEDIYSYEVRLWFDLEELYSGDYKA